VLVGGDKGVLFWGDGVEGGGVVAEEDDEEELEEELELEL
jgi:hypothetical protein